jgi:hypothetical protein
MARQSEFGWWLTWMGKVEFDRQQRGYASPNVVAGQHQGGVSIPEAASQTGQDFGDDALLAALCRQRTGSAAEVCENLVNEVRDYVREQRQADDITLIALKVE